MAVLSGEFLCPECTAKLRINQRGVDSTVMSCPECQASLLISQGLGDRLAVESSSAFDPSASTVPFAFGPPRRNRLAWLWPVVGCLIVGGCLAWWARQPRPSETPAITDSPALNETPASTVSRAEEQIEKTTEQASGSSARSNSQIPGQPESAMNESAVKEAVPVSGDVEPELVQDPFAEKLTQLGRQVGKYVEDHQKFPPAIWERTGENVSGGFSWLAGLDPSLEQDQFLYPQWNLAWDDPLNDRFVRRRRDDLLNAQINLQASPERYPATHVVGISGVGRDAASLPVSHPRAGIFGTNRSTRVEDVKDGLSNTLLAAGVTSRLSAWADGNASIRSLTIEPYVNGPDGFGTGQKQGMYVLMADGSVRQISRDVSPVVVRRMAAMADGLPLDQNIPGEPGEKKFAGAELNKQEAEKQSAQSAPASETALPAKLSSESPSGEAVSQSSGEGQPSTEMFEQLMAESGPAESENITSLAGQEKLSMIEDVEQRLNETVIAYQLASAVPLEEVLAELEAMLGMPIQFFEQNIPASDPRRKLPVSIQGKLVSHRDLIKSALKGTPFLYRIDNGRIVIDEKPKNE